MAIVVKSGSGAKANGTSVVVTKPSGVADGDVLVASLFGTDNTNFYTTSGWTIALNFGYAGGIDNQTSQHYKIITSASSEPSSYTFSWPGAEKRGVYILCLSGVDTSDPINQAACKLGHATTANNIRPAAHTTDADNCLSILTGCIVGGASMTTGGFVGPSPWVKSDTSTWGGTTFNYSAVTGYRYVYTAQTVAAHTWTSTVNNGFSDSSIIISYNAAATASGASAGKRIITLF
jgi:hypothetical protein